jgi:peroxiredoxin Q/BCP
VIVAKATKRPGAKKKSVMAKKPVRAKPAAAKKIQTTAKPRSRPQKVRPVKKSATPKKMTAMAGPEDLSSLEGQPAPAFELPDQDGKRVTLADLTARGNLVLYFYPKDMTPGCTTEACSFRDRAAQLRALGAEVVGVSADTPALHHKFIAKYGLSFPLLSDPANELTGALGIYKKKSLYGREYMGIERTTLIIDREGTIRKVFPKVKVNGHTDEVLAALKELR